MAVTLTPMISWRVNRRDELRQCGVGGVTRGTPRRGDTLDMAKDTQAAHLHRKGEDGPVDIGVELEDEGLGRGPTM